MIDRVTSITIAAENWFSSRTALWFNFYPAFRQPKQRWFSEADAKKILSCCYIKGERYIPRKRVRNPANVPGLMVDHG